MYKKIFRSRFTTLRKRWSFQRYEFKCFCATVITIKSANNNNIKEDIKKTVM